jgi:hypothetical protein
MPFLGHRFSFEDVRTPRYSEELEESTRSSIRERQSGDTSRSSAATVSINTLSVQFPPPTRKCRFQRVIDYLQRVLHIKKRICSPSPYSVILPSVSPPPTAFVPQKSTHLPEDTQSLEFSSSSTIPSQSFPVFLEYVEQTNHRTNLLPRAAIVHVVDFDKLDHFKARAKENGVGGAFGAVDVDRMEVVGLDVAWNKGGDHLGGLGDIVSTPKGDEEFWLAIELMKARGWRDRFQLRYRTSITAVGELELGTTWSLVG